MASFTHHAAPNHHSDDDFDARCMRIRQRLLDGIEETLDELAQPDVTHSLQRAAIARAVQMQVAPLYCRQVLCRRAKRCRRDPCTVPRARVADDDRA